MKNIHKIGENIYITSDEEIREGDWYFYKCGINGIVDKAIRTYQTLNKEFCKKIILTTDQDLIVDGVQSIDDDFLEWLSCEYVEVNINSFGECHMEGDDCSCYDTADQSLCKLYYPNYKIIIPKEEFKQERLYTEKEVIDIVEKSRKTGLTAEYLIEQFKNK